VTQRLTENKEYEVRKFSSLTGQHKGEIKCIINEKIFEQIFIISGSADRTVKIWDTDPKSKEVVQTLTGHNGSIICMIYSKKSDTIFTGSTDKTLRIWKYLIAYSDKTNLASSLCTPGLSAIRPSVSST
jgi:WD40 repeat protein